MDFTTEDIIRIKCKANTEFPLESLIEFQGGLKQLSVQNRDKLISSILINGFIAPLFVWVCDGVNKIIDGHQRVAVLQYLKEMGWAVPNIPVAIIEADTEEAAREALLAVSSQYGDFNKEILSEWLSDTDDDMYRFLEADEPPVLEEYHPILNPEVGSSVISEEEIEEAKSKLKTQMDKKNKKEYETVCPHCGEEFIVSV